MTKLLTLLAPLSGSGPLRAVAILLLAIAIGWIGVALMLRLVQRWTSRTTTKLDDELVSLLRRPLRWLAPLVLVRASLPMLELTSARLTQMRHLLLVLLVIASGWLAVRIVRVVEEVLACRFDVSARDNLHARAVLTQVRTLRNVVVFLIGVFTLAFSLMTFDSVRQFGVSLLASAGVAGVVIGFAAQRSIATVIAGIQIAITQPIRIDDVVIVEGEWGRVEEITLTYVVVHVWDHRRLVVPITHFIEKPFQNWTRVSAELLGAVPLHVDASLPLDEVREELRRVVEASEHWDGKVCSLQVVDATDRAIVIRPLASAADSGAQWNLRCEIREKLVDWIRRKHPECLPRVRAEVTVGGGR